MIGLGLVGQLATSLALAAGCSVVGVDLDPRAVALARDGGAEAFATGAPELAGRVAELTRGRGLDTVLICAASRSTDPVALAAELARDRGRIVVVGDVPVAGRPHARRTRRSSRCGSPARTGRAATTSSTRSAAATCRPATCAGRSSATSRRSSTCSAAGGCTSGRLTTHRFPVDRAPEAYELLASPDGERPFGILLEYDAPETTAPPPAPAPRRAAKDTVGVAFLGAGNFARGTLVPAFREVGARLVAVSSQSGLTAADGVERLGFERTAEGLDDLLAANDVDVVVIATRHASHAELTARALEGGKAVFVEKPLAVTAEQLELVESALVPGSVLMTGFNRRYAPAVHELNKAFGGRRREAIAIRVNAGSLPHGHWLQDPEDGGGRLVGEGCHFVDLAIDLAQAEPLTVHAAGRRHRTARSRPPTPSRSRSASPAARSRRSSTPARARPSSRRSASR